VKPNGGGDQYRFPWLHVVGVVLLWVGFGALQLGKALTVKCSWQYWAVFGGQVSRAGGWVGRGGRGRCGTWKVVMGGPGAWV
jgi:hypothetical protein